MCLAVEMMLFVKLINAYGARGYQTNDDHYSLCLKMLVI